METHTKELTGVFIQIQAAWNVYKQYFKSIIKAFTLPFLLMSIGSAGISITEYVAQDESNVIAAMILGIVSAILILVGIVINIIAVIGFVKTLPKFVGSNSEKNEIPNIYKPGKKLFRSFIGISIITLFMMFALLPLFIIPALIFQFFLAFSIYALALDQKKGMNALTTSFHYVRGHWFQIFGRYIVITLLLLVIGMIVGILAVILTGLAFIGEDLPADIAGLANILTLKEVIAQSFIAFIDNGLQILFATPLTIIFGYILYSNLKEIKTEPTKEQDAHRTKWFKWLMGIGIVLFVTVIVALVFVASKLIT